MKDLKNIYKRIVIKVGTSSLLLPNKQLNMKFIKDLAYSINKIKYLDIDVVLVSSGAVYTGKGIMNDFKTDELHFKQAFASIGQIELMSIYREAFKTYGINISQILLTKDVFEEEKRLLNTKKTFNALFHMNVLPIVNENDTVSTEEIEFGDNDTLSAMVSKITKSNLLIILSDVEGLYNKNPKTNKDAVLLKNVKEITPEIEKIAGESTTKFGTGGMITKIIAAKIAMESNFDVAILHCRHVSGLLEFLKNKDNGTYFSFNIKN